MHYNRSSHVIVLSALGVELIIAAVMMFSWSNFNRVAAREPELQAANGQASADYILTENPYQAWDSCVPD